MPFTGWHQSWGFNFGDDRDGGFDQVPDINNKGVRRLEFSDMTFSSPLARDQGRISGTMALPCPKPYVAGRPLTESLHIEG